MSYLPSKDAWRKALPLFTQYVGYFPKAWREVTKVSVVNNKRYNPERAARDINWARGKSTYQLDSAFHHMLEHALEGKIFEYVEDQALIEETGINRIYILAQAVWRLSAELELLIEKVEAAEAAPKGDPLEEAKRADGRPDLVDRV